jgi:hypothetical protein
MSAKDCLHAIERMEKILKEKEEIENRKRDLRESSNSYLSASADASLDAHCDSGWLQTYTGRKVQPFNLKESDIDIIDIAHQLSCIARFLGATKFFYSVAQHSILVSEILELRYKDPMLALWGLLHDGIEYIFFDVPRPLKILPEFAFYREQEKIAMRVLASKFNLSPLDEPELVKLVDKLMLRVENRDLRQPLHPDNHYRFDDEQAHMLGVHLIPTIQYKDYLVVKQEFLNRFYCLQNLVNNT